MIERVQQDAPRRPADDPRRRRRGASSRSAQPGCGWVSGNVIGVDGGEDVAGGR